MKIPRIELIDFERLHRSLVKTGRLTRADARRYYFMTEEDDFGYLDRLADAMESVLHDWVCMLEAGTDPLIAGRRTFPSPDAAMVGVFDEWVRLVEQGKDPLKVYH